VPIAVAAAALVQVAAAADPAPLPARSRTVPCTEVIDRTTFPYRGGSAPTRRYRLVLGAISVPPAYLQQIVENDDPAWPYWRKQGIVVRADASSVTLSLPAAWRNRVRIVWGNGGHGVFTTIRFAGCGGGRDVGNAYSGGFVLRSSSASVPLLGRVGGRSALVRFGLGRRCG
jgi:hypothetical protein